MTSQIGQEGPFDGNDDRAAKDWVRSHDFSVYMLQSGHTRSRLTGRNAAINSINVAPASDPSRPLRSPTDLPQRPHLLGSHLLRVGTEPSHSQSAAE